MRSIGHEKDKLSTSFHKVYAVDGSGLGDELRLVALVCVSATCPIIAAWRLLRGPASEKGK